MAKQKGFKKVLSYFYNQTSYNIDRKIFRKNDNFDLNPFSNHNSDLLGLSSSFRNSFFYNRGKQNHSATYTYLSSNTRNLLSVGLIESKNKSHQLQYLHLLDKSWLVNFSTKTINSTSQSENYPTRDFKIEGNEFLPKISYLFSKNTSLDLFYEYQKKENKIGDAEILKQNRFGLSFTFSGKNNLQQTENSLCIIMILQEMHYLL